MGRVLRTGLRALLVVLVVAVLALGGTVGWLVATNPEPRDLAGWQQLAALPEPRGESAGAVAERPGGTRFAVAGGFTGLARTSDAVTFFDPDPGAWTTGPRLPEPRHHTAAAGLDGALYVAGGARSALDWSPQPDVWVLEPDADGWADVSPLPEGRWGHRLVAHDGRLYVIGGHGGADVLVYEPEAGWTRGAPIPAPRDHLGAVRLDGEIWALGGRSDDVPTDRVDVYDPATDTWRDGPALPAPTSAAAVGVVDGAVLVVGGEDPAVPGGEVYDRAWRLPAGAEAWEDAPRPPLAVHGAADGVVDGRLVVAGGASRQGSLSVLSWTDRVEAHPAPDVPGQ